MKRYISIWTVSLMFALTSCFTEYDEDYDLLGRVATIPVLTLSPSSAPTGATINVEFRYYSEHEDVKELKLIQIIGAQSTEVASRAVTAHNRENSYEDSFTYEVPDVEPGTVIAIRLEVVTANDLSNGRVANLTVVPGP